MDALLAFTLSAILWSQAGSNKGLSQKCLAILEPDFSNCKNLKHNDEVPGECSSSKACQKHFKITAVNVEPFVDILQHVIFNTVKTCCGACKDISRNHTELVSSKNISLSLMNSTSFIYPVLGVKHELSIYGYHFIPIVELSSGYFVTRDVTPKQIMARLIRSCLNLWPLLVIIVLLALISGFIMWISDTWFNKDDFPRRFVFGWLDGFWWSFVSMTTVGYGDKIPKFIGARLFSVIWILIGVTIVAIFTGSLTNEIMSAANPPDPKMHGKNVGVLRYRTFDASFVAKHGGMITETQGLTETDNIIDLTRLLLLKKVNGIFLDKFTYMHTVALFRKMIKNKNADHVNVARFFLDDTYNVKWNFEGERMAYGVLVREEDDYQYFNEFVKHNQGVYETCALLQLNEMDEPSEHDHDIFSTDGDVFFEFLYGCIGVIGVIIVFGCVFEWVRQRRAKGSDTVQS